MALVGSSMRIVPSGRAPLAAPTKRVTSSWLRRAHSQVGRLDEHEKAATSLLQIKMDNGPESSGRRTQFLYRMVQLADDMNKPMQLLYYPPYHSKYTPIERCWGILGLKWNGTKLIDAETMVEWAKRMTWKGLSPVVELSHKVYQKGLSLGKAAMQAVEKRLKRHPADAPELFV